MDTPEIIYKYFSQLSDEQRRQFAALGALYADWNSKINLISRKDIDFLYEHHVLHSLAIARIITFRTGTKVLDVGTGGGFPGIPLAIMFPEVQFTLEDSIGKKVRVAENIAREINLTNVEAIHRNVIEEKRQFDFVVSRAVMDAQPLVSLVKKNISKTCRNALPNGLICLKGGDVSGEIRKFGRLAESTPISSFFTEPYFEQKQIVYIQQS